MTKDNFLIGGFLAACGASTVTGLWLAIATENIAWLWLCAPVVLFLS
jgi:hypothetical protein